MQGQCANGRGSCTPETSEHPGFDYLDNWLIL